MASDGQKGGLLNILTVHKTKPLSTKRFSEPKCQQCRGEKPSLYMLQFGKLGEKKVDGSRRERQIGDIKW